MPTNICCKCERRIKNYTQPTYYLQSFEQKRVFKYNVAKITAVTTPAA